MSALSTAAEGEDLTPDQSLHQEGCEPDHIQNQSTGESQTMLTSSVRSFANVVDYSKGFLPNLPSLEHEPDICPIFLGFKRIAREGSKILLIQVAAAVGVVVSQWNVDGIQSICSGWQIYIKTEADHLKLVSIGIELAGKSINLQAPVRDPNFTPNVKVILKDLPLNEVSNDRILATLNALDGVDV